MTHISFTRIWQDAAAKKGGEAVLEALLPQPKTAAQLAQIPDDRWLSDMSKRLFQAGFVWKVVEAKWDGFEAAFDGFKPAPLAFMSDEDIGRLVSDPRIIRNGQKIRAVRDNASFIMDLAREHGGAGAFFGGWPSTDLIGLLEVMKKRGSRLGGMTAQYYLRMMGRDCFILSADVTAALIRYQVIDRPATGKAALRATQTAFNQWMAESGRGLSQISRTLAAVI